MGQVFGPGSDYEPGEIPIYIDGILLSGPTMMGLFPIDDPPGVCVRITTDPTNAAWWQSVADAKDARP